MWQVFYLHYSSQSSRSLFTASFTAGEIAFKRSQIMCSKSYPDLDGEPVIEPWQFYILDHIPIKQGKVREEQNLRGCLGIRSTHIHSINTHQASLNDRHCYRHLALQQWPTENPCIPVVPNFLGTKDGCSFDDLRWSWGCDAGCKYRWNFTSWPLTSCCVTSAYSFHSSWRGMGR